MRARVVQADTLGLTLRSFCKYEFQSVPAQRRPIRVTRAALDASVAAAFQSVPA
jgi:hypothetical protein